MLYSPNEDLVNTLLAVDCNGDDRIVQHMLWCTVTPELTITLVYCLYLDVNREK